MSVQRKRYSAELKAKVALEAIKCQKTTNEIAAEYNIHPSQISQWKKQVLDELPNLFSKQEKERGKTETETETIISHLYQQIGQLKVEVDYLKKKSGRLT
jgi:transposase-like protein